ncbi:hypothetical protein LPJ66_002783 [Kickxella alabastrina]|uniref:Uncharacterized protein n=1 Tax=Kickxella alabastrina TaxID=61397 RepID=A0ACC1IPJ6_9FUNG|nr:hypothetical protein LPJ66_002783 [Kickxella alabastrina]
MSYYNNNNNNQEHHNQPHHGQGFHNQPQEFGESNNFDEDGDRSFKSKTNEYFHDSDGLDKSHIALAGAGAIAGAIAAGFAGKAAYNYFNKGDEHHDQYAQQQQQQHHQQGQEQQQQYFDAQGRPIYQLYDSNGKFLDQDLYDANGRPVGHSVLAKVKNYFEDEDGVDKSHVVLAGVGALAAGLIGKKFINRND